MSDDKTNRGVIGLPRLLEHWIRSHPDEFPGVDRVRGTSRTAGASGILEQNYHDAGKYHVIGGELHYEVQAAEKDPLRFNR